MHIKSPIVVLLLSVNIQQQKIKLKDHNPYWKLTTEQQMDLNFESFGYEYPSHRHPEPACLGFRGYELPRHGPVFPYDHPSAPCLEFEGFSPPPDYGVPPTDYRLPPICHRFLPTDCHFSPMTMTRSDYWNYSSPSPVPLHDPAKILLNRQMFPRFLQRHNSTEGTPVPVSLRRLHWYRDNLHVGPRGRRRRIVKRLDKAWSRTFPNKILILPPARVISDVFPPYPLKELQTARNTLIDELYSSQGGMKLFKVRDAVGVFKDFSVEAENACRKSYDQQAAFLLTVPLPSPATDVHVPHMADTSNNYFDVCCS